MWDQTSRGTSWVHMPVTQGAECVLFRCVFLVFVVRCGGERDRTCGVSIQIVWLCEQKSQVTFLVPDAIHLGPLGIAGKNFYSCIFHVKFLWDSCEILTFQTLPYAGNISDSYRNWAASFVILITANFPRSFFRSEIVNQNHSQPPKYGTYASSDYILIIINIHLGLC